MPGVLQIEAMAQTGAVLLLSDPQFAGKVPLFMSLDKAKFRRAVYPGDQMRIEVEVLRLRPSMSACRARVTLSMAKCVQRQKFARCSPTAPFRGSTIVAGWFRLAQHGLCSAY